MSLLLAAGQDAAAGLELVKRLHRKSGGAVVLCFGLVKLVNGHCRVDDFWLDSFLVNDRLNPLMDC